MVSALLENPRLRARGARRERRGGAQRVEERDADPLRLAIGEVNTGIGVFEGRRLFQDLEQVGSANKAEEFTSPMCSRWCARRRQGRGIARPRHRSRSDSTRRPKAAQVRAAMRARIVERHLQRRRHRRAGSRVHRGPGRDRAGRAHPAALRVLGDVRIGDACEVGPFTHLRPGTVLKAHSEIGNFTEVKNSTVGERKITKAKHLTYLGDVTSSGR
ncbi:MAG: hypothetical protein U1E76_25615 [Planctomycetota bacterium]